LLLSGHEDKKRRQTATPLDEIILIIIEIFEIHALRSRFLLNSHKFYNKNQLMSKTVFKKKELENRINELIRVPEVRLVGENITPGVYSTREALSIANNLELDLVEISPNAVPPVCKIVDYNKFLYEKKKRDKEVKSNAKKVEVKELRFTANTDEHDIEFKAKHAEKFLEEGNKIKTVLMFRGRNIIFKERGELLLLQFAKRLEEFGVVEQLPLLEGKRMMMTMGPKKKK
jgi:translation initiation factor IF-3